MIPNYSTSCFSRASKELQTANKLQAVKKCGKTGFEQKCGKTGFERKGQQPSSSRIKTLTQAKNLIDKQQSGLPKHF